MIWRLPILERMLTLAHAAEDRAHNAGNYGVAIRWRRDIQVYQWRIEELKRGAR